MKGHGRNKKGMALVLALVAVLIISTLIGGILLLSVSHYALSNANNDYSNALNLAEAGVNWELNKISQNPASANNTPATVQVPTGSGRSFAVHVEAYPSGGTWVWTSQTAFWVYSTGTVDGVSRTVRAVCKGHGLTGNPGDWALFGIDSLTKVSGNFTVIGSSGTNGYVNVSGSALLDGDFTYCGNATGNVPQSQVTGDIIHQPLQEYFPTVNAIANQVAALPPYNTTTTQGIDFFKTHNDNNNIYDSAGKKITIKNYSLDNQTFNKTSGTIVLTPGNYYFESVSLPSNNTLRINDSAGAVNIWLGPSGGNGNDDTINGSMAFQSQNINYFHLYCGSTRGLRMNGTMDFYGCVYAYNGPDNHNQYYGTISVLGNGYIRGSVIGYTVTKAQGNATIEYPSGGGSVPPGGEPDLFYGFDRAWEEINPA